MINLDTFWRWYWHCSHWQRSVLFMSIFASIFMISFYISMNNGTVETTRIMVHQGKISPQRGEKVVPLLPYFGKNHQFFKDITLLVRETGLLLNGVHRIEKSIFLHKNADIINVNVTGKYTQIRHFLDHIQHMRKRGHLVSFQWRANNNQMIADCVILLQTDKTKFDRSMILFDVEHDKNMQHNDNNSQNPFLNNRITDVQNSADNVGFLRNRQTQWVLFKTSEGKIHTVKTVLRD